VDEITGGEPIQIQDLSKLNYLEGKLSKYSLLTDNINLTIFPISAVMRETLRLAPTAPARTVTPVEDVVLGGKFFIKAGTSVMIQSWMSQRDPAVWGEDVSDFKRLENVVTDSGQGQ